MISWKLADRTYSTPLKRFNLHLFLSPNCKSRVARDFYTFQGLPSSFWQQLAADISSLIDRDFILTPDLFIQNDFSNLSLALFQKNLLLAAFTAAKKLWVVTGTSHIEVYRRLWALGLLDIISMELSNSLHTRSQHQGSGDAAFDEVKAFINHC